MISEFDFKIKHVKYTENCVAYALSGRLHENQVVAISLIETSLKTNKDMPLSWNPPIPKWVLLLHYASTTL